MPFLEITDLNLFYPIYEGLFSPKLIKTVEAVKGVSLKLEKGEILGLVGESGCGKSSLSRAILQLEKPTSGSVLLEGKELTGLRGEALRKRRLDFQMIFQDPYASLNPRMTVYEILKEAIKQRHPQFTREALDKRIFELMDQVGLSRQFTQKYPNEFSGGQRQRVAIARALAPEPKLIIADEPVSALDVSIQSQILNLLSTLRKDLGLTMIFISHDLSVVQYLVDQIAVMNQGKIVEYGKGEDVFNNPQDPYTKMLLDSILPLS